MRLSMSEPTTVAEIVSRIAHAHTRFAEKLALIPDNLLQEARLSGGRSGKDLLAHMTFWDRRLLHAIAPEGGPDAPRLAPPLIADIPYDERWLYTVNDRIFTVNQERPLVEVKAAFYATCVELCQTVQTLSEHDVFDPGGLSAPLGEPFAPMVLGAYGHYEEHMPDLEHFLVE